MVGHGSFCIYLIITTNASKNSFNGASFPFLCKFENFRKVTISFVMSVSPSVDME